MKKTLTALLVLVLLFAVLHPGAQEKNSSPAVTDTEISELEDQTSKPIPQKAKALSLCLLSVSAVSMLFSLILLNSTRF